MADDKTFAVGEVLSAADTNEYLVRGYWKRISRQIIPSGSPVSTVTFSSIESRFRSFRLHMNISSSVLVNLNNDSGTNYNARLDDVDGSAIITASDETFINFSRGGPQIQELIITKLSSSSQGVILGDSVCMGTPGNVFMRRGGYSWENTSALINRIDVSTSGTVYGVFTLEGMVGV